MELGHGALSREARPHLARPGAGTRRDRTRGTGPAGAPRGSAIGGSRPATAVPANSRQPRRPTTSVYVCVSRAHLVAPARVFPLCVFPRVLRGPAGHLRRATPSTRVAPPPPACHVPPALRHTKRSRRASVCYVCHATRLAARAVPRQALAAPPSLLGAVGARLAARAVPRQALASRHRLLCVSRELGWPPALCHAKHSRRASAPLPPPCVVRPGWPLALCHTKHSRRLRPIWGCRGSSAGRSRCATPSTRVAPPSPLCVADHRLAARAVPHQALASRPIPLRVAWPGWAATTDAALAAAAVGRYATGRPRTGDSDAGTRTEVRAGIGASAVRGRLGFRGDSVAGGRAGPRAAATRMAAAARRATRTLRAALAHCARRWTRTSTGSVPQASTGPTSGLGLHRGPGTGQARTGRDAVPFALLF